MKTTFFSILFLLSFSVLASSKTIINPHYEFKKSGIYNVTKIELTDTATLLTINNTFIPHWWVQFNDYESIRNSDTGQEFKIKGIIGAVMNEKLWMPDSGDSAVVLIFPPLPTNVKKIDYSEGIYGISLDASKAGERKPNTISPEIERWLNAEQARAKKKTPIDFKSNEFYNETPARIIGCIKGFDKRAGSSTGIIYASNEFTRNDYPIVVKIEPDGRFEAELPLNNPKYTYAVLGDHFIFPFYIEPGHTLTMIFDWDEFLTADRKRNIRYQFNQIEFRGPLADLNQELLVYPEREFNYNEFDKKRKTMAPMDFDADQQESLENNLRHLEDYLNKNKVSAKAQTILRNSLIIENATRRFDYTMSRDYYAKQDSTNEILKLPVPGEYYNFLKKIDLNDPSILVVREFSSFINRFEYCEAFKKAQQSYYQNRNLNRPKPEKNILEYFVEEKIELPERDLQFLTLALKGNLTEEEITTLKQLEDVKKEFNTKYKDHLAKYAKKYVQPQDQKMANSDEIDIWKAKDSVLVHEMGLAPNLCYEIAKVRSLKFTFQHMNEKERASEFWSSLKSGITTPYLIKTGDQLLTEIFPDKQIAAKPLPKGPATQVFRKITDPYKGKILFVDFWATTCGPCVAGIKNMKSIREKYQGNPDFEFIFITDERSSPLNNYNSFVKEQELKTVTD
jgi:thiol-disulfide isomerase/thioredoxin